MNDALLKPSTIASALAFLACQATTRTDHFSSSIEALASASWTSAAEKIDAAKRRDAERRRRRS